MKKFLLVFAVLLAFNFSCFSEKYIALYPDLKIELFPVLKSYDELDVDIVITNITGRTCYIPNALLNFESSIFSHHFGDDLVRMNRRLLWVKDENGKDLLYIGVHPSPHIPKKWERGKFTRVGKGKSITRHITNLFNSYPDAKDCETITIYTYALGAPPVTVHLK